MIEITIYMYIQDLTTCANKAGLAWSYQKSLKKYQGSNMNMTETFDQNIAYQTSSLEYSLLNFPVEVSILSGNQKFSLKGTSANTFLI